MIYVVIGTKAQLIKMAPVMVALRNQGLPYRFISTGQHRETTQDILDNFDLRGPDHTLYDGPDITSIPHMGLWGARLVWRVLRRREEVFGNKPEGIVLVHGDTLSTLLGALMGRAAGLTVGHVESGLRSFNWLHPFPEEITRLMTFGLTHVHFFPGACAVGNLQEYEGERVNAQHNTRGDAIRLTTEAIATENFSVPTPPLSIFSFYRSANTFPPRTIARIFTTVEKATRQVPVLFFLHKVAGRKLHRFLKPEPFKHVPGQSAINATKLSGT